MNHEGRRSSGLMYLILGRRLNGQKNQKKKGGATFLNFWIPGEFSTSVGFCLRLFAQHSTVIRAVFFSTSTTNFFYVPTRTLRHLHLRFFNNFYVTKLRTSKPPIGPYFFHLGLGLGLGLGFFQNTRISMDRDSREVLLPL